jgi:hypothetical protein
VQILLDHPLEKEIKMKIKQIHSMFWANPEHTAVGLNADTDEENNLIIGTPYDGTSIIWEAVQAYPVDQIFEHTELWKLNGILDTDEPINPIAS